MFVPVVGEAQYRTLLGCTMFVELNPELLVPVPVVLNSLVKDADGYFFYNVTNEVVGTNTWEGPSFPVSANMVWNQHQKHLHDKNHCDFLIGKPVDRLTMRNRRRSEVTCIPVGFIVNASYKGTKSFHVDYRVPTTTNTVVIDLSRYRYDEEEQRVILFDDSFTNEDIDSFGLLEVLPDYIPATEQRGTQYQSTQRESRLGRMLASLQSETEDTTTFHSNQFETLGRLNNELADFQSSLNQSPDEQRQRLHNIAAICLVGALSIRD